MWTKCTQVVKTGLVENTDLDFEKSFCQGRNINPWNQNMVRIKHWVKMRLRIGIGNTSQTPPVMLASLVGTLQISSQFHSNSLFTLVAVVLDGDRFHSSSHNAAVPLIGWLCCLHCVICLTHTVNPHSSSGNVSVLEFISCSFACWSLLAVVLRVNTPTSSNSPGLICRYTIIKKNLSIISIEYT